MIERRFTDLPHPAFQVSVVRLSCSACGAEANASCNCGKPYIPVQQRVAEYDKANPGKSERTAAADLGVSKTAVHEAREAGGHHRPPGVTGRDGKQYPARRPLPSYMPDAPPRDDPSADGDLIDQIINLFEQLTRSGRVRCAVQLRKIIDNS